MWKRRCRHEGRHLEMHERSNDGCGDAVPRVQHDAVPLACQL